MQYDKPFTMPIVTNMNKDKIQGHSVKKQIEYQKSIIEAAERKITEIKSDIDLAEKTIGFLESIQAQPHCVDNDEDNGKKDYILSIISDHSDFKGAMIPEIKEDMLRKHNISMSSNTIDAKIQKFIKLGLIYQVNPESKRGKRYKLSLQNAEVA